MYLMYLKIDFRAFLHRAIDMLQKLWYNWHMPKTTGRWRYVKTKKMQTGLSASPRRRVYRKGMHREPVYRFNGGWIRMHSSCRLSGIFARGLRRIYAGIPRYRTAHLRFRTQKACLSPGKRMRSPYWRRRLSPVQRLRGAFWLWSLQKALSQKEGVNQNEKTKAIFKNEYCRFVYRIHFCIRSYCFFAAFTRSLRFRLQRMCTNQKCRIVFCRAFMQCGNLSGAPPTELCSECPSPYTVGTRRNSRSVKGRAFELRDFFSELHTLHRFMKKGIT